MTTIRRGPLPIQANPSQPRSTVTQTESATAPPASSFDPVAKFARLVEAVRRFTDPVSAITNSAKRTDWFNAPLEVKGISGETDVKQGALGDCYMVATVAAIAHQHPQLIRDRMRENPDGTVTFTFFGKDPWNRLEPQEVTVTRELPTRADGSLPFGQSGQHEAWFPLLEKAYAQFKGGVQAIGNGGFPSEAQEALLGTSPTESKVAGGDPHALYAQLESDLAAGRIVTVTTPPRTGTTLVRTLLDAFRATVSGVIPQHVYSVWGTQEVEGRKYVLLRNPWACAEPGSLGPLGSFSRDGKNDGVFAMPVEEFAKRFSWLSSAAVQ